MLVTVLITNKSFVRTFLVHINEFTSKFIWLTINNKIRNGLTSGITNDRITCITGKDRCSNTKCFVSLANTIDITDIIAKGRLTNSWWSDELANTTDLTDITSSCIETNSFMLNNSFNIYWVNEFTNTIGATDNAISSSQIK